MKKLIFTLLFLGSTSIVFGQISDLNGVTFGFGAGYSGSLDKTYDYTLTTDAKHKLKIQPLNKGAFVISSVLMVKLGKVAVDQSSDKLVSQAYGNKKTAYDKQLKTVNMIKASTKQEKLADDPIMRSENLKLNELKNKLDNENAMGFWDHFSVDLALNLVNVSHDVTFNKNIDGGLGIGYLLTQNLQLALFYDVSRVTQLRDYIVTNYTNKQIPNGDKTYYNSLDIKDNNLFYNKTISGLSIKLVFSLAEKKAPASNE